MIFLKFLTENKRKGDNLIEYTFLAIFIAVVIALAFMNMKEDGLKNYFSHTFSNSTQQSDSVTIGPLSE